MQQLCIFTRYPIAGQVKTRLTAVLTPEEAAKVHQQMTEYTVKKTRHFVKNVHDTQINIAYTGADEHDISAWLGTDLEYQKQVSGDLGQRMWQAIANAFITHKVSRIVIIGTDCPALTDSIITEAFTALKTKNVVIGPAYDGGYYLIGFRYCNDWQNYATLFENIAWGGERVFQSTLDKIWTKNLSYQLLTFLLDVDTPEDLVAWYDIQYQSTII